MDSPQKNDPQPEKAESWKMFDEISPRYDLVNRILSWGQDVSWRKKMADYLPNETGLVVLDLATGTADVLLALLKVRPEIEQGLGLDLSDKMLTVGRRKVDARGLAGRIILRNGDAQDIPNPDNTFSAVTIAFGIRNLPDPGKTLSEMYRVLKKGGRAIILEFSLPANPVIRFFHLRYLRYGVPIVGGMLSGNFQAYSYLNRTIEQFPYGKQFLGLMGQAGFEELRSQPLLLGAATIYYGKK